MKKIRFRFRKIDNQEGQAIGWCLIILIFVAGGIFLPPLLIKYLWNWLAPLFWSEAPILTYWQAFGVNMMLALIGGTFRGLSGSGK